MSVGQALSDPGDPSDRTALAMASFFEATVLALADGSAGVPASRAAADGAVRAVVAACRAGLRKRPSTMLGEAFGDAHRAVLGLAGATKGADKLGAACVAVHFGGGVATVARAGRVVAYHVRAGLAEAVFPELPGARASAPLGAGASLPPPAEVEVVPLEEGDRLVLASLGVARSIDSVSLARLVWSLEPQVAANRLFETARAAGATSLAVQVLRREGASLAGAMERLHPGHQRDLGRRLGEEREQRALARGRRLWSAIALAFVAAMVVTAALVGFWPAAPQDGGLGLLPQAAAPSTTPDALAGDVGSPEAARDQQPGARASARPSGSVDAVGGERVDKAPDTAPDTVPDMAPDMVPDMAPDMAPEPVPASPLDAIFAQDPDTGARALRGYIIDGYAREGQAVFAELESYVRDHPGRATVDLLVSLLRSNPPPRTRRWILDILPHLYPAPPSP